MNNSMNGAENKLNTMWCLYQSMMPLMTLNAYGHKKLKVHYQLMVFVVVVKNQLKNYLR